MARNKISLTELVDQLDEQQSIFANFFRPMLGYDALLELYEGIDDGCEKLISEIEDETGYQFPEDVIAFYLCTNGGVFGDIELFPISTDSKLENEINKLNVYQTDLKESIGLDRTTILLGKYIDTDTYIICNLNDDGVYQYSMWDANARKTTISLEYLIQLLALEISYNIDNEDFVNAVDSSKGK